jgi:hypothetical protein
MADDKKHSVRIGDAQVEVSLVETGRQIHEEVNEYGLEDGSIIRVAKPYGQLTPSFAQVERAVKLEDDSHAWFLEQADAVRHRNIHALDWENLAEELETMGVSQRRELTSRLRNLLFHLLKWQIQPNQRERRSRSWILSIREARREIVGLIKYSPSLKHYLPGLLAEAWGQARDDASLYLKEKSNCIIPETCPWEYDVFIADDFFPLDSPSVNP